MRLGAIPHVHCGYTMHTAVTPAFAMRTRFLVGDVFARMAELPSGSVDLILTSPPFLALRSYLPADHPDKARELGNEGDPAGYLAMLLRFTAECGRLLAPHGSLAVELGDTYAGSGGGGGDYLPGGWRADEPGFGGSAAAAREGNAAHWRDKHRPGAAWPLDKSLAMVPALYGVALAYGIHPLTGEPSPAGRWRVRNVKAWIRPNPPVGALADKERPGTSYVTVATKHRKRYFDLDGVRSSRPTNATPRAGRKEIANPDRGTRDDGTGDNPAGAPPRDWWSPVDAVVDAVMDEKAAAGQSPQGFHVRRALELAGLLGAGDDVVEMAGRGYRGAHYAVWPPELVQRLVSEMCPRKVCTTCGEPSRRAVAGWTDCGHGTWRTGVVLDPFVGSGTTLAVTSGSGYDGIGIDLDERNAGLAGERVGMFLEVDA